MVVGAFLLGRLFSVAGQELPAAPAQRPGQLGAKITAGEREKKDAPAVIMTLRVGSVVATATDPFVELASAGGGRLLRVADTRTGQRITIDTDHFAPVPPKSAIQVLAGADKLTLLRGSVPIVEIRRGRGAEDQQADEMRGRIIAGAVAPDGRHSVTAHHDHTVRLWDVATGREVRTLWRGEKPIQALCYGGAGQEVLSASTHSIVFFKPLTGQAIRGTGGSSLGDIRAIAVSPDGRMTVTAAPDGLRAWSGVPGILKPFAHHMEVITSVAISLDGKRACCFGGYGVETETPLAEMARVWDLETGKVLFDLGFGFATAVRGAFSSNGQYVAVSDVKHENRLAIWDVESGAVLRYCETDRSLLQLAFSADSGHLATVAVEGTVEVFSVKDGRLVAAFSEPPRAIQYLGWSANGMMLVGGNGTAVRRWELPILPFDKPAAMPPRSAGDAEAEKVEKTPVIKPQPAVIARAPAALFPSTLKALPDEEEAVVRLQRRGAVVVRHPSGFVTAATFARPLLEDDVADLKKFPKLGMLTVSRPMSEVSWAMLPELPTLRALTCTESEFSTPKLIVISRLTKLQQLHILGGKLDDLQLSALEPLTRLESLLIHDSEITDQGLVHLVGLRELRGVDFSRSRIAGPGLVHLSVLPRLEQLSLEGSPMTNAGLGNIEGLANLTRLKLGMCSQISDEGLRAIGKLRKLQWLEIQGTRITDEGLAHLQGLSALYSLRLDNTKISDRGIAHLEPLKKLNALGVAETQVSDEALRRLREAGPKLSGVGRNLKWKAPDDGVTPK